MQTNKLLAQQTALADQALTIEQNQIFLNAANASFSKDIAWNKRVINRFPLFSRYHTMYNNTTQSVFDRIRSRFSPRFY